MELSIELIRELTNVADLNLGKYGFSENRKCDRVWLGRRGALTVVRDGQAVVRAGVMVRDISQSGIGLVHTAKLAKGSTFVLSLTRGRSDDEGPGRWVHIECTVVRCERGAGAASSYVIGATFLRLVDAKAVAPAPAAQARPAAHARPAPAQARPVAAPQQQRQSPIEAAPAQAPVAVAAVDRPREAEAEIDRIRRAMLD